MATKSCNFTDTYGSNETRSKIIAILNSEPRRTKRYRYARSILKLWANNESRIQKFHKDDIELPVQPCLYPVPRTRYRLAKELLSTIKQLLP
jgi:hypothetical protein